MNLKIFDQRIINLPAEIINNPKKFFDELGGLHDANIEKILLDIQLKSLCISVDDLNSNFLGLPEYQGLNPVDILFVEPDMVDINVQEPTSILRIYDMDLTNSKDGRINVRIDCSPGGYLKYECGSIELRNKQK